MTAAQDESQATGFVASAGTWQAAGSLTWFAMDGLWLLGAGFAVVAALGCLSVAAHVLLIGLTERQMPVLGVNAAETAWVAFNLLWLVDDFQDQDWALLGARVLFFAGATLLLLALLAAGRERGAVLPRFRRLRTGID